VVLTAGVISPVAGEHVDYTNIMTAAERIQTILSLLNRRTEVEHSKRKMQELQNKVTGTLLRLVHAPRAGGASLGPDPDALGRRA
jgi:hypothetical protein